MHTIIVTCATILVIAGVILLSGYLSGLQHDDSVPSPPKN